MLRARRRCLSATVRPPSRGVTARGANCAYSANSFAFRRDTLDAIAPYALISYSHSYSRCTLLRYVRVTTLMTRETTKELGSFS